MIDLRSDTVTKPTAAMRRAMAEAEVGDDVFGEDPTVNALEEYGAALVGKEAALFVPSGTMGNQVAIAAHTSRGDEAIVDAESHIFYYENGGPAVLSSVQLRPVAGLQEPHGAERLADAIRPVDLHAPQTRLVCFENTHNRAGGTVLPPRDLANLAGLARSRGLAVHLDGARIFNAAAAAGCDVREFTRQVDSVMFCLSKGLAAPVGSLLAGSREFIGRARKIRKLFGGGMRQAGILAAAGLVALKEMVGRLTEDHANARRLGELLSEVPGLRVDLARVQTNILLVDFSGTGLSGESFLARLREAGVLAVTFGPSVARFVTHKDVSAADVAEAVVRIRKALMK
ncbi:MAG: low-specificity L-threonine aldolase [Betaproteobacteria bacterium]